MFETKALREKLAQTPGQPVVGGNRPGNRPGSARDARRLVSSLRRLLAAFALVACSGMASAQDYPAKPVRIIVSSAPGGQPDIAFRVLAQQFSLMFNNRFLVENIPGANGKIGRAHV